jgi:hypothetical protein
MASKPDTKQQPWKKWYSIATEVKTGSWFVWPTLLAGNGPGNGADKVLSLAVDLSQPKPKPQSENLLGQEILRCP